MTDDLHDSLHDLLAGLSAPRGLDPSAVRRGARLRAVKVAALGGATALAVAGVGVIAVTGLPGDRGTDRLARPAGPAGSTPSPQPRVSPPTTSTPTTAVLEPDGLGYLTGSSSLRHLTFASASPASVEQAMTSSLGVQPVRTALPDCGPHVAVLAYRRAADVLSVYVTGTRFVGWADTPFGRRSPGADRLTTADGNGLGTTLTQLRGAYSSVTVTTGTVGPEFSTTGGLAGGLTGTRGSSTVNRIGAGSTCIAR